MSVSKLTRPQVPSLCEISTSPCGPALRKCLWKLWCMWQLYASCLCFLSAAIGHYAQPPSSCHYVGLLERALGWGFSSRLGWRLSRQESRCEQRQAAWGYRLKMKGPDVYGRPSICQMLCWDLDGRYGFQFTDEKTEAELLTQSCIVSKCRLTWRPPDTCAQRGNVTPGQGCGGLGPPACTKSGYNRSHWSELILLCRKEGWSWSWDPGIQPQSSLLWQSQVWLSSWRRKQGAWDRQLIFFI